MGSAERGVWVFAFFFFVAPAVRGQERLCSTIEFDREATLSVKKTRAMIKRGMNPSHIQGAAFVETLPTNQDRLAYQHPRASSTGVWYTMSTEPGYPGRPIRPEKTWPETAVEVPFAVHEVCCRRQSGVILFIYFFRRPLSTFHFPHLATTQHRRQRRGRVTRRRTPFKRFCASQHPKPMKSILTTAAVPRRNVVALPRENARHLPVFAWHHFSTKNQECKRQKQSNNRHTPPPPSTFLPPRHKLLCATTPSRDSYRM